MQGSEDVQVLVLLPTQTVYWATTQRKEEYHYINPRCPHIFSISFLIPWDQLLLVAGLKSSTPPLVAWLLKGYSPPPVAWLKGYNPPLVSWLYSIFCNNIILVGSAFLYHFIDHNVHLLFRMCCLCFFHVKFNSTIASFVCRMFALLVLLYVKRCVCYIGVMLVLMIWFERFIGRTG